jgi:hypothetical protein
MLLRCSARQRGRHAASLDRTHASLEAVGREVSRSRALQFALLAQTEQDRHFLPWRR